MDIHFCLPFGCWIHCYSHDDHHQTQQEELRVQNTPRGLASIFRSVGRRCHRTGQLWTTSIASDSDIHQLESQWRQSTLGSKTLYCGMSKNGYTSSQLKLRHPPNRTCRMDGLFGRKHRGTKSSKFQQSTVLARQREILERTQFVLLSSTPALRTPIQQLQLSPKGTLQFLSTSVSTLQTETLGGPQNGGQALLQQSLTESNLVHGALIDDLLESLPVSTIADYPQAIA